MKKSKILLFLLALLTFQSCSDGYYEVIKKPGNDDFNFPGNYIESELKVDGKDAENEWKNVKNSLNFGSNNKANLRLYRGEQALYAFFKVKDEDLQVVGNNDGDDVTKGDSIEIYFDFLNDGGAKPQQDDIQINIGVHGRTRLFVGTGGEWGSWNGLIDYAITIDGTLNSLDTELDVDKGYNIELMIPYKQVGILKDSPFSIALGCVSRGIDSTNQTLDYSWDGLVYDGNFIDPQKPSSYISYVNDSYYLKANAPKDNISLDGYVYTQDKKPLANATLEIDGKKVTSNFEGYYHFEAISPNMNQNVKITKEGLKERNYVLEEAYLKDTSTNKVTHDFVVIDDNVKFKTLISGKVKNPVDGEIANAKITINDDVIYSSANGDFSYEYLVNDDLNINVSKKPYIDGNYSFSLNDLAGNEAYDIGIIALYSASSSFTFGGARTTCKIDGEVFRGFTGINFIFKSQENLINGDHVELFIDTKESTYSRDDSDYRIDFSGDGSINIVNFKNGINTNVYKSKIKTKTYLLKTTYYIEAFIPYEFLKITSAEIIGFSCGSYKQATNDWDGLAFIQDGFNDYVAPEYPQEYLRINIDNGLYRSKGNDIIPYIIYGKVSDGKTIINNAFVNNRKVNEDGTYKAYLFKDTNTIECGCVGYETKQILVDLKNENLINLDIVLTLQKVSIKGYIIDFDSNEKLANVKVYLKDDPANFVISDSNGYYEISCTTAVNAELVFELEGYETTYKTIAKQALVKSYENKEDYEYNAKLFK